MTCAGSENTILFRLWYNYNSPLKCMIYRPYVYIVYLWYIVFFPPLKCTIYIRYYIYSVFMMYMIKLLYICAWYLLSKMRSITTFVHVDYFQMRVRQSKQSATHRIFITDVRSDISPAIGRHSKTVKIFVLEITSTLHNDISSRIM